MTTAKRPAKRLHSDYIAIAQRFKATVMRLQGDYSAFKATAKDHRAIAQRFNAKSERLQGH
jgi:hypothetical protein